MRSPTDIVWHLRETIYQDFDALNQEHLWTLLLNTKSYVTHQLNSVRSVKVSAMKDKLKDHARTKGAPADMRRLCDALDYGL